MDGIQVNKESVVENEPETPLYAALCNGYLKVVGMLLAVDGIQVNQADNKGWTPLNIACEQDHSKVVEMLIAVDDIEVNQADNEGDTPLISACQYGQFHFPSNTIQGINALPLPR